MVRRLVTAGVVVAGVVALLVPAASANPLPRFALPVARQYTLDGAVKQTLQADSYDYLLVQPDAGEARWVATLHAEAWPARVHVTVMAEAPSFESKRLGRRFQPLAFGAVRSTPAVP